MLSNKLTFSLVFVVMCVFAFAFVVTPVIAQTQADVNITTDSVDQTAITNTTKFIVSRGGDNDGTGVSDPDSGGTDESVEIIGAAFTVDLEEFLRFRGTIELLLRPGDENVADADVKAEAEKYTAAMASGADDAAKKATLWNDFVITEIMWGHDGPARTSQWIEVYNNAGKALPTGGQLILRFTPNERTTDGPEKPRGKYVLVDRVSTVNRFGQTWDLKGQNGNTSLAGDPVGSELTNVVSMYRTRDLDKGNYKEAGDGKFWNDGTDGGSWAASAERANIAGYRVATPFSSHVTTAGGVAKVDKTALPVPSIIINEVRNDTSEANLDWIELFYNTDSTTAKAQSINNWELSIVTSNSKDDSLAVLPNYKMKPGEYLVVYSRDPGKSVKLAGGENLNDIVNGKPGVNKGASHKYVISRNLNLPSTGKFLILLRDGNDKKTTHEKIVDYAGNGFFAKGTETDVWPFKAWTAPGDNVPEDGFGDNTFASMHKSYGRIAELNKNGEYGAKSNANRIHKNDWQAFEFMGAGYDRGRDKVVDPMTSPGTPGYPNVAVNKVADDRDGDATKAAYAFSGKVSISEIMYDAGPRWNLVQWIELYNSSATETIKLDGWELEIRNEATDIETYVDSIIEFADGQMIPPNQTLLLVSSTGTNDVPSNYVYNLTENHPRELGVQARGKRLLSNTGFHLELRAPINKVGDPNAMMVMDEVGNVMVKGAARLHQWDLPADDPSGIRKSIVRIYGSRELDGSPDDPSNGTMEASWAQSDLAGAGLTFYGHRDDIGTPGYRLGGPLPVSLSSFRPVRDDVTGHVVVRWATESELNNAGFNILRSETKNGEFKVVNVKGIVPGHGTTSEKHVYEWTDTTAKPNVVYYYQIEDVSLDGNRTTLVTTRLKGHVSAAGKLTTTWGDLKHRD